MHDTAISHEWRACTPAHVDSAASTDRNLGPVQRHLNTYIRPATVRSYLINFDYHIQPSQRLFVLHQRLRSRRYSQSSRFVLLFGIRYVFSMSNVQKRTVPGVISFSFTVP